jgi:NhaA family Na+:H+ antiporter
MALSKIFRNFFQSEKSGGFILIVCTIFSLLFSNSLWGDAYIRFWNIVIQGHSIQDWINDGLMAVFFLLIGLELKREIVDGELSNFKLALFPIVSALGGVVVPILFFLLFNLNTSAKNGAGIPMATDIAFAIGILSILGKSVPTSLKVFLTALAVIDDLMAILVIAFFYTTNLCLLFIGLALFVFILLMILNRLNVRNLIPYLLGGVLMWYFMLHSGVHATLSGVLLAFAIPFEKNNDKNLSIKLQHSLHFPVAYVIIPLFALANTCIVFNTHWMVGLYTNLGLGIIFGLVIGKPLGIILFYSVSVYFGWCKLPDSLKWKHIAGVSILGGIGFTMSIFITQLAFQQPQLIDESKIAIIFASIIASTSGLIALKLILKKS